MSAPAHGTSRPDDTADEVFMRAALAEAQAAASEGEVPVGAVVACDGRVVAAAHNRREEPPDPLGHAEVLALREAAHALGRWRLTGCTLYVTCEPCPMCAGALLNARVDRVVYGVDDPKAGALGSLFDLHDDPRLNHGFFVKRGVLAEEAGALLSGFFAGRREEGDGT